MGRKLPGRKKNRTQPNWASSRSSNNNTNYSSSNTIVGQPQVATRSRFASPVWAKINSCNCYSLSAALCHCLNTLSAGSGPDGQTCEYSYSNSSCRPAEPFFGTKHPKPQSLLNCRTFVRRTPVQIEMLCQHSTMFIKFIIICINLWQGCCKLNPICQGLVLPWEIMNVIIDQLLGDSEF